MGGLSHATLASMVAMGLAVSCFLAICSGLYSCYAAILYKKASRLCKSNTDIRQMLVCYKRSRNISIMMFMSAAMLAWGAWYNYQQVQIMARPLPGMWSGSVALPAGSAVFMPISRFLNLKQL